LRILRQDHSEDRSPFGSFLAHSKAVRVGFGVSVQAAEKTVPAARLVRSHSDRPRVARALSRLANIYIAFTNLVAMQTDYTWLLCMSTPWVLQPDPRAVRPMVKGSETASVQLVLRVQASIAKRADELRPRVARDPNLSAVGRISRSTVLKLALLRGLAVLEQEYK